MNRWIAPLSSSLIGLFLAACTESGLSQSPGTPDLTNLGLVAQASELASDGDLVLIAAREFESGRRDLDQDGDALDAVAFAVDLGSGAALNTMLALDLSAPARLVKVRGPLAFFAVSERQSGARDRNGDGDANDAIAFVHDARNGSTNDLGLALTVAPGVEPAVGGNLVAFSVSEAAQGADLDGSGALDGDLLHLYDASTRQLTRTDVDVRSPLFLDGSSVAFFAAESGVDRNGDGDALDLFVLQVFDPLTGTTFDTGLATDGDEPIFAGGSWLVAVPEEAQGRDLDSDGEATDRVLHTVDPASRRVSNLGIDCIGFPCAVAVRPPAHTGGGRELFALLVPEPGRGDRNGDGDALDRVLELHDPRSGTLESTGVASVALPAVAGAFLGFLSLEVEQGADLDGDGDRSDAVAFATDTASGTTTNLRQAAIDVRGSGDFLLLARPESTEPEDWNRDGDLSDVVVHAFDTQTGRVFNTRIASVDVFGAGGGKVLLYADEAAEGSDLNLDGDRADQVFVLHDLARAQNTSLGLAGGFDAARFGNLTTGGHLVLLANELSQGRDLNGDGDRRDDVVYRGE